LAVSRQPSWPVRPPGCCRRQPGGGDMNTEPPACKKPVQHWVVLIGTRRQPGWPVPSGNLRPNLSRSARAGGPHSPPAARSSPPGAALIGARLSPRVNSPGCPLASSVGCCCAAWPGRGGGCRR
jgi:hypothetical protein